MPEYVALAVVVSFALIPLLFARLLKWEVKRVVFWVFLCLPIFFLCSALLFFFFLESDVIKIIVSIFVTLGLWVYAEALFSFYHFPRSYQAYSLEFLSLVFSVVGMFFFASGMYAMSLFMQLPLWIPAIAVFVFVFLLCLVVLWVSKIAYRTAVEYALVGAVCLTELYIVFAFLPTSFLANAAGFMVILYIFLGLSRASALSKLSKTSIIRYLSIGGLLLFLIFSTTRWI